MLWVWLDRETPALGRPTDTKTWTLNMLDLVGD
jgi:hypothetical protein